MRRPSTTPSPMLRTGLGLTGDVGVVGTRTTDTLTGLSLLEPTLSRSATVLVNCLPSASAMRAACCGSRSRTATSIRTVSSGTVAVTLAASASAVVLEPQSS